MPFSLANDRSIPAKVKVKVKLLQQQHNSCMPFMVNAVPYCMLLLSSSDSTILPTDYNYMVIKASKLVHVMWLVVRVVSCALIR